MNTLRAVLLVACVAFASALPYTIYNDWASFEAVLPSDPSLYAFDDLQPLDYPPYLPTGAVNWGTGFPTYAFSQNGFSYSNSAAGSTSNNLGPCTPDGGNNVYMEAYAAGGNGVNDGTLYYDFTSGTLPTLFGALVCSTTNGQCDILADTITVTVNGNVVLPTITSVAGTTCPFWGFQFPAGIQTLSFAGQQLQQFAGVSNITLAVAVNPGGQTDPHFTGFQGEKYDFYGYANNWYNLISSPKLQMNALFESSCEGRINNFMTALAINIDGHKLFINNTREATLDGVAIPNYASWNAPILIGAEGVSGKIVHPWLNWFHIQTSELIIIPTVHNAGGGDDFNGVNCISSYFNFQAELLAKNTYMHGILGQSAQHHHTINAEVPLDVEGTDSDYVVSGPWGVTSKFNVYKGPQ